jgi:prolipoprotein diacylglyceryltransferase
VVECFRGDELRGAWFGQSTSQWIALLMVIGGVALLARLQVLNKT